MSEQAVIEIKALNKTYPRGFIHRYEALKNVDLSVKKAEIFGFLGPNGAGKTTLIKSILGLLKHDSGSIRLFGKDINDPEVKSNIGYLPETPNFYSYLTAFEIMKLYARLYNMKDPFTLPSPAREEGGLKKGIASQTHPSDGYTVRNDRSLDDIIKEKLELVGLKDAIHTRLRAFSKGMLQRLGMAQALINEPALLILDEPMSGLDPIGRAEFKEIMRELKKQGKTIFFSSHIIPDAEELCDRVAIIRSGRIIKIGSVSELMDTGTTGVDITAKGKLNDQVKQLVKDITCSNEQCIFHVHEPERTNMILSELIKNGFSIIKVEPVRQSLETLISKMIKEKA
ncbi:MAG: ABC transporter ATP-binding protein [bacterium]